MELTVKVCPLSGDKFFYNAEGYCVRVENRNGDAVVLHDDGSDESLQRSNKR